MFLVCRCKINIFESRPFRGGCPRASASARWVFKYFSRNYFNRYWWISTFQRRYASGIGVCAMIPSMTSQVMSIFGNELLHMGQRGLPDRRRSSLHCEWIACPHLAEILKTECPGAFTTETTFENVCACGCSLSWDCPLVFLKSPLYYDFAYEIY